MNQFSENNNNDNEFEVSIGLLDTIYHKLTSFRLRVTRLWSEIVGFSKWFEFDAAALTKKNNPEEIWIELQDNGDIHKLWIGGLESHEAIVQYHMLWEYLASLGICKLCIDLRLEMNQIQDIFVFIKSHDDILRHRKKKAGNAVSDAFRNGKSIHFACADISIKDNVLFAKYSYCTLKYSKLVHWLEKSNRSFRDHRSLFHMAPRYGFLVVAIILIPSLLLAGLHKEWFIFFHLMVAGFALYGIMYLFFMVVGSVEYDNEEKNYRLCRAYTQLQVYASRIQADIKRAQTIQQCFLPDTSKMPLPDWVDWASSYKPAEEVGGDFFDAQPLDDDRVVIIFGDVCGHGMAAALITAVLKTTFQEWIEKPTDLEKLAAQLNRNIYHTTPMGDFAAVFVAILNGKTGNLEYINCGHNPEPWVLSSTENGQIQQLSEAGCMILGVDDHIDITKAILQLRSGDGIIIVSDGIIENQNIEGDFYEKERFEKFLKNNNKKCLSELVEAITGEAESFSKGVELKDDQTLLAFCLKHV